MAAGNYFVNDNAQPNGDHEVHVQGCYWLSLATRTTPLGYYWTCADAVRAARAKYRQCNGCAYCSAECHTQ